MADNDDKPTENTPAKAGGELSTLDHKSRAAILLMSLGEKDAAELLKHLGPKEVQAVGATMAALKDVTQSQVEGVVAEFLDSLSGQTGLGLGADEYIRNMLTAALGTEKAGGLIDRILLGGNTTGLDTLKWMESRAVSDIIRHEHPQIQAIVIAYLDADQAAEILYNFDEKVRLDIMMRVASLQAVQPAALMELNDILEKQFSGSSGQQTTAMGGVKVTASIINNLDSTLSGELLDQIKEMDEEMGVQIQDLMFVFENLNAAFRYCYGKYPATCSPSPSRAPTTTSRKKYSATCPNVQPNCCVTIWKPKAQLRSAKWKWLRKKSWLSPAVWPMPARSPWAVPVASR